MRKFLAGLGSLIALAVIIVGVPAVLLTVAGNPLPSGDQLSSIFSLTPDYGNVILLTKLLPLIGWAAWALFAIPMVIEICASVIGRPTRKRTWAFKGQQQLAATMIAAILVMFAGFAPALASAEPANAAPAPAAGSSTSQSIDQAVSAEDAPTPEAAPVPVAEPAPPVAEAAATVDVSHTVAVGDTLWGLAEAYYGDGTRDIDIYKASFETVQPDGTQLTDPDLIRPGWTLTIPGMAAPAAPARVAPATPAPAPTNSAAQGGDVAGSSAAGATQAADEAGGGAGGGTAGGSTVVETPAPAEESTERPSASDTAQPTPAAAESQGAIDAVDSDENDLSIPLATAGGIGGLLAAGLLGALGRRRLQQRRRRQSGTRIAMPEGPSEDLELELRMVENPLGIVDIDNALRGLQIWAEDTGAVLPELFALRLESSEIALYLTEPAELPAPFVKAHPDGTAWIVEPGTATAPTRDSVSPYPALTTIGVDVNDGVLMLDLEQIGSLNIVGDDDTARGLLNAMAVELAENPWADQIQVTLVGMPHGLARDLNRFRVQHVDDVGVLIRNIRNDMKDRQQAFESYDVDDVHQARVRATEAESWAPHIVILAEAPTEDLQTELADLVDQVPRLGVATVSNGATVHRGATVRISSREGAELISAGGSMPALPFNPQMLEGEELRLIQDLFDTTEHDAVPATPTPDPVEAYVAAGPSEEEKTDAEAATAPDDSAVAVLEHETPEDEADTAATDDVALDQIPSWPAPYVRILGKVDALHVSGGHPMPGRGIELMTYLLLNGKVQGRNLRVAFWPDTPDASNNQRGLARKVHLALGHTPDGERLLPENENHEGYTLHPAIRSDWDDFRDLVGNDLSRTSNENLVAAIKLVRGQPFSGCDTRRWWQWISIPQEEMIAAIMDAADELGRRSLAARDANQARYAAHVAQSVDPLNEAGWRTELRAAMQAGDTEEFSRIVDDLYARVGGADPEYELDDETQELVSAGDSRS